ncbi:hypothetical protein AT959_00055 [Dechloromonas denitrificans]|uniref:Uncharacterized protein n=1 Tax=Dechloromonas denitrificans TaxID=281362 RepID=A0A133XNX2_9RHOO|nr:hypothetical protein [Dechloromonas denitrificans]KXB32636.1 hypothetical protein AT959_00055 [Dechloromonas denitrificans]
MMINTAELVELIREVEAEDPIDYGDLPYAEEELRLLVCDQVRDIAGRAEELGEEESRTVLLAVAAKLVLENLVLHVRLMQAQGLALDDSCAALFRRLRGKAGS